MSYRIHLVRREIPDRDALGKKSIFAVDDWTREGDIIRGVTSQGRFRYWCIDNYDQVWVEESGSC